MAQLDADVVAVVRREHQPVDEHELRHQVDEYRHRARAQCAARHSSTEGDSEAPRVEHITDDLQRCIESLAGVHIVSYQSILLI